MSRTTLTVLTAAGLVTVSVGMMVGRYYILGDDILVPRGPNTWKVTMRVDGNSLTNNAKVQTITPLSFGHQHIKREKWRSAELVGKLATARHPERPQVLWSQGAGVPPGPFHAYYEFYCVVDVHRPSTKMAQLADTLYAAPAAGDQLKSAPGIDCDDPAVSALARRLTAGREGSVDQTEALFRHVDQEVRDDPNLGGPGLGAVDCLKNGRGDAGAKSRLLVALCRNRSIPARLVTGLRLVRDSSQISHTWAEAWVRDQWLPMCPFYHHYGRVPATYLIFGFGDQPIVRGHGVRDLDYAYLVEHTLPEGQPEDPSPLRRTLKQLSLDALQPPEARMVEFLLLLPIAALIVCVFRNLVGVNTFGTFAPALVGLAFRELQSLPGILVFVSIVLLGWGMRRILDHYHLLQVPRTAFMLSLVVIVLILTVVVANCQAQPIEATKYIPLFPIVILTGMIERFWTLEAEDGTGVSFKTLVGTMAIAASISLLLSIPAVINHMVHFPETLGLIMAAQLLIGRYTGYRLSELFRFRDFVKEAS